MPGGVVVYPSAAVCAAVKRQVPNFPMDRFKTIGSMYHTEAQHVSASPKKVRKKLQKISETAAALYVELGTLSEEARNEIFDEFERSGREPVRALEECSFASQVLMGLGRNAALNVNPAAGRPQKAKNTMVRRLAAVAEAHQIPVNADATGDLCFLVQSLLEGYGDSEKRPDLLVSRVLCKMSD